MTNNESDPTTDTDDVHDDARDAQDGDLPFSNPIRVTMEPDQTARFPAEIHVTKLEPVGDGEHIDVHWEPTAAIDHDSEVEASGPYLGEFEGLKIGGILGGQPVLEIYGENGMAAVQMVEAAVDGLTEASAEIQMIFDQLGGDGDA